jgi:DNA-binding response OmpR family regulator
MGKSSDGISFTVAVVEKPFAYSELRARNGAQVRARQSRLSLAIKSEKSRWER